MFQIKTNTSWQKENTDIQLRDLNQAFDKYPLIEKKFFKDLKELCQNKEDYFVELGLLQVKNQKGEELEANFWIFLWAIDKEERNYHILIERNPEHEGRGAIAAAGPDDFYEFMSGMKHKMLLPFLGMINTPEKMKKVGLIVSKPKSHTKMKKEKKWWHALSNFQQWIGKLKQTPNIDGKWFPGDYPRCPECNNPLIGVQDEKTINLGHQICPFCGYKKTRPIVPKKRAASFYDLFRKR